MMKGKENTTRAIEFKGPAYLPCTIGANLDWLYDKDEAKRERVRELAARFPLDMLGWVAPKDFGTDMGARDGVRRWRDQWGTGWEDDGHGAKTETYPLESGYKRMFDRVRGGGAHVWMHLCGNITAILPDLIEIGLNVLNPVQPQAMDVRQLAREFGGKVCFNGGTSHSVMPETPLNNVIAMFDAFSQYQVASQAGPGGAGAQDI